MAAEDLDIGAVLDFYEVQYRADRRGEQSIRCPVHEDRVASASLNLDKSIWNCHACGKGGDAINIIRERELLDYEAALERYETITGTSGKRLRKGRKQSSSVRVPPGSGYRPRIYRNVPPGIRKRTDFGA